MPIGHIQNLDLFSVNKVISELNQELTKLRRPGERQSSEGESRLFWDERVGTPVSEFSVDEISLKQHESVRLNAHIFTGSATNLSLVLNKNTNAADYHNVSLYTINGAAALASSSNDSIFAPTAANDEIFVDAFISYSENDFFSSMWMVYTEAGEDLYYRNIHYLASIPQEDITSIKIVSSTDNAIGKYSHVRMWRAY